MSGKKAQFKIQQMAFMVIAVFFFFILVGMAYLGYQYKGVQESFQKLQKEEAIRSLQVLTELPELSCSEEYLCIDEDKIYALASKKDYGNKNFWPIASIRVYKIYPSFEGKEILKCPAPECNYYEIYDSKQTNIEEYATYVSLCRKVRVQGYTYNQCDIGKLSVGVKIAEVTK